MAQVLGFLHGAPTFFTDEIVFVRGEPAPYGQLGNVVSAAIVANPGTASGIISLGRDISGAIVANPGTLTGEIVTGGVIISGPIVSAPGTMEGYIEVESPELVISGDIVANPGTMAATITSTATLYADIVAEPGYTVDISYVPTTQRVFFVPREDRTFTMNCLDFDCFTVPRGDMPVIAKDPNATLDYIFDWSSWLAEDDEINAYDVTVSGVDLVRTQQLTGQIVVWLSGGSVGQTAIARCQVTTVAGRTDDRTIRLNIVER